MKVVEPLKNLTIFSSLPGPKPRPSVRSWAVKTLGRLDPDKLIEMIEGKPSSYKARPHSTSANPDKLIEMIEGKPVSKAKSVIEFTRNIPKFEKDQDINRLAADAQQNLSRSGVK